jgi:osmotically-inducible protein OsmY
MSYSDQYGDRDRDRERDWIRDERMRARDRYDDSEARRLERSYSYPSGGRDYDRDDYRERDRMSRGGGRDEQRDPRGYSPFGATGPTYYDGGYGEPRRYPGDVGRTYAGETDYRNAGREHEIPRGHYFGDTSRYRDHADYVPNPREGRGEEGRSWLDKATDEVQAFFGDEDARRRRHWDEMRHGMDRGSDRYSAGGEHRGRGPRGYRRSDERIREDVSDRLTDDPWLDASYIDIEVKDGEVTLSGLVARRDDKRRAEDIAEACSGVGHVQNNLRVQTTDSRVASGEIGTMSGTSGERRDTLETGGATAAQANTRTNGRA